MYKSWGVHNILRLGKRGDCMYAFVPKNKTLLKKRSFVRSYSIIFFSAAPIGVSTCRANLHFCFAISHTFLPLSPSSKGKKREEDVENGKKKKREARTEQGKGNNVTHAAHAILCGTRKGGQGKSKNLFDRVFAPDLYKI